MGAENQDLVRQIIAKIWADPEFKAAFLADPKKYLLEAGTPLPDHRSLKVHENTPDTVHLIIPEAPVDCDLTDEQLQEIGFFDQVLGPDRPAPVPWTGCCDITIAPPMFED